MKHPSSTAAKPERAPSATKKGAAEFIVRCACGGVDDRTMRSTCGFIRRWMSDLIATYEQAVTRCPQHAAELKRCFAKLSLSTASPRECVVIERSSGREGAEMAKAPNEDSDTVTRF